MKLNQYFERIGYQGPAEPTVNVLGDLLRAHALCVPFENLDVQLGHSLTVDPGDAYEKIVTRQRGGWCYEQNGLFGWALSEIGFGVTRLSAAVMRAERGEIADGNHLTLVGLLLGGTGQDNAAGSGFFLCVATNDHTVIQRTDFHLC